MKSDERRQTMDRFRSGDISVLVSTPATEEGLDVAECQLVVRFDKFNTVQSHIQGAGRARHVNAKIYYFENDPVTAQRASKRMISVAQNPDCTPQDQDQEAARNDHVAKRVKLDGIHPFGGGDVGAEVSVYNCRDVVYAYCAKVWKEAFSADSMYEWSKEEEGELLRVIYPTPDGLQSVTREDVECYWAGVNMQEVFDPVRCKRYGRRDRDQMRFLFLLARRLREARHLDEHNQPTVRAREMTQIKCPAPPRPLSVNINPKFQKAQSSQGITNPKGILHEWCQRKWGAQSNQALCYSTTDVPGGFRSSVAVVKLKLHFQGDVKKSKKLAEQSAAEKALAHQEVG